jgi:molybdate transport system permease protein
MTALATTAGEAVRLSLGVAAWCVVVATPLAVAFGWLLARRRFPGKALVTTIVYSPLVLPPVVTGFLLLRLLGRRSVVGGWLSDLGLPVPFTFAGAVVASLVVGFPLYVAVVRGAFESVDRRYDEVAMTLGLRPRTTFSRVTLPLALPGILAGAVLAFARALGEFGATIVLAGDVAGETRTISIAVYGELDSPHGEPAAWALVGVSLALCLAAMLGFELLTRRHRRLLELDRGH